MAQQPTLAVRGEAVLEVDPEIARIEVSVAAVDRDRAKTLKLLNERAMAVDKVLAGFPDAIEKTETSGIRVSPQLSGRGARDQAPRYHGAVYQTRHGLRVRPPGRADGPAGRPGADRGRRAVVGPAAGQPVLRPGPRRGGQGRGAAGQGLRGGARQRA